MYKIPNNNIVKSVHQFSLLSKKKRDDLIESHRLLKVFIFVEVNKTPNLYWLLFQFALHLQLTFYLKTLHVTFLAIATHIWLTSATLSAIAKPTTTH